jgi:uncharacterized membrane protein (DUF373 family)
VSDSIKGLGTKLIELVSYKKFELAALGAVLLMLCLIAVYMIAALAIQLFEDFQTGLAFAEKSSLQDTFGLILSVLIVLEFSHSVHISISKRTGPVLVGTVILISILVVARKLIFVDYASAGIMTLLGYCAVLLSLGVLYWLIKYSDRERTPAQPDY